MSLKVINLYKMKNKIENLNKTEGLEMYFNPEVAKKFSELEQNEKNFNVAKSIDNVICQEMKNKKFPVRVAELGGGSHPDRYDKLFNVLTQEPKGQIDWVEISPYMIDLAKQYLEEKNLENRKEVINFIESDILEYLSGLKDSSLDFALMKYTFDHIKDIETLFQLLQNKLKKQGKLIATMTSLNPQLKSISTNARFLYNGEEFSVDETRGLQDGDNFTIKFFKVSGDPSQGFLEGAQTTKYFYSSQKISELSKQYNLDIFLGD
jgi:ubiquinone/menaquinone biosynthesis C-methylase UbiE